VDRPARGEDSRRTLGVGSEERGDRRRGRQGPPDDGPLGPDGEDGEGCQPDDDGPGRSARRAADEEDGDPEDRREEEGARSVEGGRLPLAGEAGDDRVRGQADGVRPDGGPEGVEEGHGRGRQGDGGELERGTAADTTIGQPGDEREGDGEDEAAVDVRPEEGERHDRPPNTWSVSAELQEPEGRRETDDAEELGPERQARRGDDEGDQEEDRRPARVEATPPIEVEQEPEGDPDESAAEDGEPRPSAGVVDDGEGDLGEPLLVQPGGAGRGEGERVGAEDFASVEDLLSGPDGVGEVDGREGHGEGDEDG